jgi:hypothetical protein
MFYNILIYFSVFSGVRVTQSLVLYVSFVDRSLSCCAFSFGHCVVCSSSIYGFWLPLWYLQTFLYKLPMLKMSEKHFLQYIVHFCLWHTLVLLIILVFCLKLFCFRPVSCVHNVTSFSGLFILCWSLFHCEDTIYCSITWAYY